MAVPTPPREVRDAASRAVRWIAEGRAGRELTDTDRLRALRLAEGADLPDADVRVLHRWFSRHPADREADGFRRGTPGFPSPRRVAWDAHGGDGGERWSAARASA